MGIGNINLGSTPCCGLISRTYECYPDEGSETGYTHNPGGDYAPDAEYFEGELDNLDRGICPDCGRSYRKFLVAFGHRTGAGNFSLNQEFYCANTLEKKKILEHLPARTVNAILEELKGGMI